MCSSASWALTYWLYHGGCASRPSYALPCMQTGSAPLVPPPGQLLLLAPLDQDDTRGIDQSWPPPPNFCQGVVGVREALGSLVRARSSCWCPQGTDSFLQESTAAYKSLQQLQGQWGWLFLLTVGQQQKEPTWRNLSNNKKCNKPLASHLWCIFF